MRMTRQPLILSRTICSDELAVAVHHAGGMRSETMSMRDRRHSPPCLRQQVAVRKEPAQYWFDRRHIEQFEVRCNRFEPSRERS